MAALPTLAGQSIVNLMQVGMLLASSNQAVVYLTGNPKTDLQQSRDKRIFNDPAGLKAARNDTPFLLQTYVRDTGEILSEISLPIMVKGRHWGALRLGFDAARLLASGSQSDGSAPGL